ncbi:MAG: hypothetical protein BWY46_00979 [Firmicutes bacterium ADurb.Bin300]|nr:MAG: hypothetical protein BWY46_00979 [Firmicutes bacterium ADurb.Bin300]
MKFIEIVDLLFFIIIFIFEIIMFFLSAEEWTPFVPILLYGVLKLVVSEYRNRKRDEEIMRQIRELKELFKSSDI